MIEQKILIDFKSGLDMKTHSYGRGSLKVLLALRREPYVDGEGYQWVTGDELFMLTHQRRYTGRISELRTKNKMIIEWNGKAGEKSAYRLCTRMDDI